MSKKIRQKKVKNSDVMFYLEGVFSLELECSDILPGRKNLHWLCL